MASALSCFIKHCFLYYHYNTYIKSCQPYYNNGFDLICLWIYLTQRRKYGIMIHIEKRRNKAIIIAKGKMRPILGGCIGEDYMNLKNNAKDILKRNPIIIFTYIAFVAGIFLVNLPEILVKIIIKIISAKTGIKWIKLATFFIDIPVSVIVQIAAVVLFFAYNYYIFNKACGLPISFKLIRKKLKLNVFFKFVITLIYSTLTFILCQLPTIFLGLLYLVYYVFEFITDKNLPFYVLILYFTLLLTLFVLLTLAYIKRFGLILYIFMYNPERTLKEIFTTNKYLRKAFEYEFKALVKSYVPMFLLCFATCGIYFFYFIPCFKISLIKFITQYYNVEETL